MADVTVYSTPYCPYCRKAKALLEKKGVTYKEIDVSLDPSLKEEMIRLTGRRTVPQITIGGEPVGGYDDISALDAQGILDQKLGIESKEEKFDVYDVIIVGAGPAGMTAAVYAARKGIKTLIVSKDVGGQMLWTADVENYLGYHYITASDLIDKFEDHIERFDVERVVGVEIEGVEIDGKLKTVITKDGKRLKAKALIIATGKRPRQMNIPGETELTGRGVTYCATCDAPLFRDANTAVIGGGNSALEAVADLLKVAKNVYLVSRGEWKADAIIIDKVKSAPNFTALTFFQPQEIKGKDRVEGIVVKSLKTDEVKELEVEGVFVEIGLVPNTDFLIDVLETNDTGEIIVDCDCNTGVRGVFAAGDVTNVRDKQIIVAAGEGSKAALRASEYLLRQR